MKGDTPWSVDRCEQSCSRLLSRPLPFRRLRSRLGRSIRISALPTPWRMRSPTTRHSATTTAIAARSFSLVDFHVERDVYRWPDREVRHVRYTGNFYSSADTSKSIPRNGDFGLTLAFDGNGDPISITRTGVMQYVIDRRAPGHDCGRARRPVVRHRPDLCDPQGRCGGPPGRLRRAELGPAGPRPASQSGNASGPRSLSSRASPEASSAGSHEYG